MGLPTGIWPPLIALLWVAEALPAGRLGNSTQLRKVQKPAAGTAGNPPASDEILHINQELIPPEAPGSSFLLEGDIIKVSPFRVFSSASPKWPKRRGTVQIPYIISYKYDKPSVELIKEAFADFAKFTCIKFVPYSYQRDFISIMPMSGCFSSVGRTGGMQVVSLAPACLRRGKGVTLHELMHVVGFWHEHSRADRDKYISISWNEILTGFEINFMKSWNSNMLVNYDYSSVMHYGRYAFSMTGLPTITPLANPDVALGQRWNLSSSDIARVNKLYKCSRALPEPVLSPEGPTESTTPETRMNFIPNEPEPCPAEGEIQVSTSSPGTKPPETGQSTRRPSSQMTSTPRAGTEELMDRTPMDGEGLSVSPTPVRGVQPVTFEPTTLSTQGMTYLAATGKPPPPSMEMGTVGAEGKPQIPTEEISLLGTESSKKPDLTTVMVPTLGLAWLSEMTSHHGKAAEGLGTTKVPTEALAGLEFPELVSPRVALVETGGTRPGEVGLAETGIQGTELAHLSTYLAQKGPSPATEVGVVTLSSNQTVSLESQMELATAETTSSLESSGTYTAALLSLGLTPPEPVNATETLPPTSTEKWTTNLARLTSAKAIIPTAPTRTRSTPTQETPSVEMETITMSYATEQTSLLPPVQNWSSSPTKQGNQSASSQAYSPGSREQGTILMPLVGMAETEPPEVMQPTLTTSIEMVQNHSIYPVEIGVQGATARYEKGTALSSLGIETTSIVPLTQATTPMETQTELGFIEATKIKAGYHHGSPSLTEGTFFPVTQVKDAKYATEAETLPVDWVSQGSEPAEIGMQATKTNYRNGERLHTNAAFPVGGTSSTVIGLSYTTPSLGASENPVINPPSAGPAETTRSEARNQASLSTRRSPEMGVQEASNTPPYRRRGLMETSASVFTSSTAAELRFMERPTREESGLEIPVPQASRPSEMVVTEMSPAWTEAKDQLSSSGTREAMLFPMSSPTGKGYSTQSPESASLPEVVTKEHRVHYSMGAGLPTLTNPSTGTANTTSIGASLQDTSPVLSTSTEMKGQEAPSSQGQSVGVSSLSITPAGMGTVTRESEHRGHPTQGTLVQETQSPSPHGRSATETTSNQTRAPNLFNTEAGTPIADTATEVVRSTRGVLLPKAPENKTLGLRDLLPLPPLSTTHPLPSDTLSTETAEQVQSTQVNEQTLPENGLTSHPEQVTGKPTTNTILTAGENTRLPSMGGMTSLEAVTHWLNFAEGTLLQKASPHQNFSPTELQIKTRSSQETRAMIHYREEYGQTSTSPEGTLPAETEALELLGLFTKTVFTHSPETPPQRLEEVGVFHRKKGRGKPSPLSIGTTLSAEKETDLTSSTKTALGMEALAGQTTSQRELEITEVSGAQLLGSPASAERTSSPEAEATRYRAMIPSHGTETPTILPGETRESIPTARTPAAGTEATGQSYSTTVGTTVKAAETPHSPSERGYTTPSGYRKKNGEQAYTPSPVGRMSSAGSHTAHASPFVWPTYYQTALTSTEHGKTPMEPGAPSPAGGVPSGEVEPTYIETQSGSPPGRGNGGKYTSISRESMMSVGHWDLGNEISTLEQSSSLPEKWALNTTLANGLSTLHTQMLGERHPTSSAVGVMPAPGAKEAHGIKVTQLKRPFRKHPSDLFAVDPELLHLVGKRSLPDAAPCHDCNPDLRGIPLNHGPQKMQSPLLSNTPTKLRAKALKAFPKQHILLPEFHEFPITGLHPVAKAIKPRRNTSETAPDHTHGLFRPKELLLGRKKTSLAPFLLSTKAVQAKAPSAMDKPSAAPLPSRQSGSGKPAHHILPAQRATAQPGWQICDFEKDLCSWQQSDADDFDWILAGERPSAGPAIGGNVSEETPSGRRMGGYISLKSPSVRQTPGQKTSLISPILHRLGCIHFWYSPLGSIMGTINIYLKLAEAPEWHRIWFAEGQQGTDWHQVSVEASESQKLQVMVEGVIGPDVGSDVGIDDLAVCVAECRGGCDELMALYEK